MISNAAVLVEAVSWGSPKALLVKIQTPGILPKSSGIWPNQENLLCVVIFLNITPLAH